MTKKKTKDDLRKALVEDLVGLSQVFGWPITSSSTDLELYAAAAKLSRIVDGYKDELLEGANAEFVKCGGLTSDSVSLAGGRFKVCKAAVREHWVYPNDIQKMMAKLAEAQAFAQETRAAYKEATETNPKTNQLFMLMSQKPRRF